MYKTDFNLTTLTRARDRSGRYYVVLDNTFGPVAVVSTRQEAYEEQVDYEFGGGWKRFMHDSFGWEPPAC